MSTFTSGWVGGDDWYTQLDASVSNINDTTARVTCKAYVVSRFGVMRNSTHCKIWVDGAESGEVTNASFGANSSKLLLEWSRDVARGTKDRKISVSAKIWALYGPSSYAAGATASGTVTISRRGYSKPNPPKDLSLERVSDEQHRLTWKGDYTGMDGDRPWATIAVERRTDEGRWEQLETLTWDAVNYTDHGTSAGHRYTYRLSATGAGGTSDYVTTADSFTTPTAPAIRVSKSSESRVDITIQSAPMWVDSYEVEVTSNGGSTWRAVSFASTGKGFADDDPPAGTISYRVRAVKAGLNGAWGESNSIVTIVAPGAPSIIGRPGYVVPVGASVSLVWSCNHPDGTAQTAAQVEYTVGSTVKTVDVAGATATWRVPSSVTASACSVRVRVRTKGLDPSWGAWSAYVAFSVAVPPQAHFTSPSVDGVSIDAVPFTMTWAVTDPNGIAQQVLRIIGPEGTELLAVDLGASARSYKFSASTYLPQNLKTFRARLDVRSGSSLSASATRSFRTDYSEPAMAYGDVQFDDKMAASVTVEFGDTSWGYEFMTLVCPENGVTDEGIPISGGATVNPDGSASLGDVLDTVDVSIIRVMPDGSQWLVGDGLGDGQTVRDPLPPLNTEYEYLVTSYSEAGTATSRTVTAYADSDGREAYNFGPAAEKCFLLGFDATGEQSVSYPGESFHFAIGPTTAPLPTFYGTGDMDASGRHSYVVVDKGEFEAVRRLLRDPDNAVCWFRDAWGGRCRALASWSSSYDATRYMRFEVASNLTEVVFEEAYDVE